MPRPCLILASSSPRRVDLLRSLGLTPRIAPPEIDEDPLPGESAREQAQRLAQAKARSVAARLSGEDAIVLGADTIVAQGALALGKPRDDADARRMLQLLCGRAHEVFTAVHLVDVASGREAAAIEATRVLFRDFDARTLLWYVASGEPRDKAGAYSIQGKGCLLARRIEGSWSNVVGLPLELLPGLFEALGVDFLELLREAHAESAHP